MSDPAALLEIARDTARQAVDLIERHRRGGVEVADTKSSEVDVVTEADRASEELIRRLVGEARPGDGFLGEEGDDVPSSTGVRWVVDPIDGTVNFLYGIPQYAVSIAAQVRSGRVRSGETWETVAGVVVNAATGTAYAAHAGDRVATRDGERIAVRPVPPLGESLVLTGFWYDAELRRVQAAATANLLPQVRDIRRLGSCALDLCHVAEGSADGYVEEGVQPWDHAAGGFIAQCAGARLELTTGAGGRTAVVCAPEGGFERFRQAVADAGFLAPAGPSGGE